MGFAATWGLERRILGALKSYQIRHLACEKVLVLEVFELLPKGSSEERKG